MGKISKGREGEVRTCISPGWEAGLNRGMVSALHSLRVGAVQGRKENRGSNEGCRLGVCCVVKDFACCSVGSVVRFLHRE